MPRSPSPRTMLPATWSPSTAPTSAWASRRETNCALRASIIRTARLGWKARTGKQSAGSPPGLAARSGGVEVYRVEQMELREGDRIRWTRNDKELGLVNSQTAEVTSVKGDRVSFRLEDGRALGMTGADSQLRHVDRAWASTVHAFQGRTVDTVIAAMEANHPNLTNQKTLYVEISRAGTGRNS